MNGKPKARPFTGRHMTAILVAFFAVVITVNVTMARLASSTFGGTVVDNSYVASQKYNEWLARAAAQDRLGWNKNLSLDTGRHILLAIRKQGQPLGAPHITATLSHPLGREASRAVHFVAAADDTMRSVEALPAGRWRLDLSVRHGGDEAHYREDLQ